MKLDPGKYQTHELIDRGFLQIGDGYRAMNSELSKNGIPFARAGNINDGFKFEGANMFPIEDLHKVGEKKSRPFDSVFTSKGSVGRIAYVKDSTQEFVYSPQLCYWRSLDHNSIDPRFLNFWMNGLEFKSQVDYLKGQTDMADYVSLRDQRKMTISIPEIEKQFHIAKILADFDDKIELNRQINQTLEQIAQAIFKSWFVDFEPVKAKVIAKQKGGNKLAQSLAAQAVICGAITLEQLQELEADYLGLESQLHPLITDRFPEQLGLDYWTPESLETIADYFPDELEDSELGEIPKGWEWSSIGEEVDVVGGGTPSTKNPEFWEDGGINWTSPKDLSGLQDKILLKTEKQITDAGLAKISSGLLPVDTVLMSSRAPVGYLAQVKIPVAINQGYIAMKCNKRLPPEFVLLWADSVMDEIKQRASGSTFAEISKKNFKPISVVVPDVAVLEEYSKQVKTIFNKITETALESKSLSNIRDSLLPKLLSGEIALGDTQSASEAVA